MNRRSFFYICYVAGLLILLTFPARSRFASADEQIRDAAVKSSQQLDDLFRRDAFIDVNIRVDETDWSTLCRQSRTFFEALGPSRKLSPVEAPYTYVDATVTLDGQEYADVGIRKKGFIGSQSSWRPSLKVKLDYKDKAANLGGATKLTLNNNKQDSTVVNQYFGFEVFRSAGVPAPRCTFAHVQVNGLNLGVYSHVESIRKPFIRREFGSDQGTLYEGTVVDFHPGWEGSFEHKFGDDTVGRQRIKALIEALKDESIDESTIGEFVDLDAFYKFWAVEGLLGSWDGYSGNHNNFFFYLHPKTNKFHFIPWGLDAVFDKYGDLGHDEGAPISVKTKGLIAHRLYQTKTGRARYKKELLRLLDEQWNEAGLLKQVDQVGAAVKPHLARAQAWQPFALKEFRQFVRNRRNDVMAEIENGMPPWNKEPNTPFVIGDNWD